MNSLLAAFGGAVGALLAWRCYLSSRVRARTIVVLGWVLLTSFLFGLVTGLDRELGEWRPHGAIAGIRATISGFAATGSVTIVLLLTGEQPGPRRRRVEMVAAMLAAGLVGALAGCLLPSFTHLAVVKAP